MPLDHDLHHALHHHEAKEASTMQTLAIELTEKEAIYLINLLEEEGRGLLRRPSVIVSCLRKLDLALTLAEQTNELKRLVADLA